MNPTIVPAVATAAAQASFGWDQGATIIAGLGAALVAALIAVVGYSLNQRAARKAGRAELYAAALQAVEDYIEGPYRIQHKDGSDECRRALSAHLSDVKSRISFHTGLLSIHAPDHVRAAYEYWVAEARAEAGTQMTAAWASPPTTNDLQVPLGQELPRVRSDAARAAVHAAMKKDVGI